MQLQLKINLSQKNRAIYSRLYVILQSIILENGGEISIPVNYAGPGASRSWGAVQRGWGGGATGLGSGAEQLRSVAQVLGRLAMTPKTDAQVSGRDAETPESVAQVLGRLAMTPKTDAQ
ncbi:MAG: hypothetical protein KJZ86_16630, partial [Caldilineaceae bacterium]|nr:hypothetical protein [Caldilineaceae bacterium]